MIIITTTKVSDVRWEEMSDKSERETGVRAWVALYIFLKNIDFILYFMGRKRKAVTVE
jgi:hypothetical protein